MKPIFSPFLYLAQAAFAVVVFASAVKADTPYSFQTINNAGDPAFNQLLGINDNSTIAGYFGDGVTLPNKGYTVVPPYDQPSFTNENVPGSAQTQVVGINNQSSPLTVGFWVDPNGDNYGFVKNGVNYDQVVNPNTPAPVVGTPTTNQLLGVNDGPVQGDSRAVGFYNDANGNSHGYIYNIQTGAFSAVIPNSFSAVSLTATGINNFGLISGFYTDAAKAVHGFIENSNTQTFTSLNAPGGTNTMLLGLNNKGQAVGSFVNGVGVTNGVVYNLLSNTWQAVNDPNQSSNPAFNVTGTTITVSTIRVS